MKFLSDRWRILKEALGVRRFLVASTFGAIVAGYNWYASSEYAIERLTSIPAWAVGLIGMLFLLAVWILEHAVKLQNRITGTRTDLSQLRSEGVELRNEGRRIIDEDNANRWKQSAEDWNLRVINKIKEINEADGIWFSILDIVPDPRVPTEISQSQRSHQWARDHERLYRWHDFRVMRLGEMIRELWRD